MTTLVMCAVSLLLAYYYSVGYPLATGSDATPLWRLLAALTTDRTAAGIAGIAILILTALMLQRLNLHLNIIRHKTKLPFLLFFALGSMNLDFMPFSPAAVAMLFFLPALFELFRSDEFLESTRAFNAAAMIAIGSLIWIHVLWFIPVYWYGMYKFKLLRPRNLLATVLGLLTVYWILFGWCFWHHDYTALTVPLQRLTAVSLSLPQNFMHDFRWISVTGLYVLLLIIVVYIRYHGLVSSLRTRQTLSFLLTVATYAFALLLLRDRSPAAGFLYFFYMPVSLILACFFSGIHGVMAFLLYYAGLASLFLFALTQVWFL
jgi:hypothetical protein